MMVSCLMCGAGAVGGVMDGWHGCGPQAGLGGGAAGDMELIEYQFPLLVHRYGFTTDSGGAGRVARRLRPDARGRGARPPDDRGRLGRGPHVPGLERRRRAVPFARARRSRASRSSGTTARSSRSTRELRLDARAGRAVRHAQRRRRGGRRSPSSARRRRSVEDVSEGFVSGAAARDEYGVALDAETLEVELEDDGTASASSALMGYRIGIDTGGTFTDLVLVDSATARRALQDAVDPRRSAGCDPQRASS